MDQEAPVAQPSITAGAGFGIRLLARVIDIVFGLVLGLVVGLAAGIILVILQIAGILAPGWEKDMQNLSTMTTMGIGLLGNVSYHAFTEGIHGASVGKLLCQLRVLQEDGQASNMKGALIRSLGFYVDSLFFGAVGYLSMKKSPFKQRFGDVWGHTVVVKAADVPAGSQRRLYQFVMGLLIGTTCYTVLFVLCVLLVV